MRKAFSRLCAGMALALTHNVPAVASGQPPVWVTLGTIGGPLSSPARSQPANMLLYQDQVVLIDVGDGTVQQMAKSGVRVGQVNAVLLSHLHFDHTGGLGALLGLHYQNGAQNRLEIYGPPGTRALVAGLLASMKPAAVAGYGIPGAARTDPRSMVKVHELSDGETVALPEATVRVGHGRMRERDLERLMLDFYHRRFEVLVCTTIIESGIDVPTANTILIDGAERFGLAQLHQLRGRVGRSHHCACPRTRQTRSMNCSRRCNPNSTR